MLKRLLTSTSVAILIIAAYGQNPTEEFFKGLDLISTNLNQAKREFYIAYHSCPK